MSNSDDLKRVDFAAVAHDAVKRMKEKQRAKPESDLDRAHAAAGLRVRGDVLTAWGVPERASERVEVLKPAATLAKVQAWHIAPREAWCLALSGPVGTGKSTAAGWWLWMVADGMAASPKLSRRWWTAPRLMRADAYDGTIERLASAGPLVLDDIGEEYSDSKGALMSKLDGILDERYGNYRPTLICTNLNAAAFRERYGDRVADRINEATRHGGGFWELAEPSMRARP